MNIRLRTLLPALLLPALLTAPSAADAAVTISNGFLSARTTTTVGFDFTLGLHGTVVLSGTARPTSIQLTCSVDTVAEGIACDGTLSVQGTSAAIRMDFDGATGVAAWAIAAGAPAALDNAHEQWGEEVVPNAMGVPDGWDYVEFYSGGEWRRFYYSTTWAETFESITGLPYSTVTDIWTW